MQIGKRFKGTPCWGEIHRATYDEKLLTAMSHSQKVTFTYGNKRYTATFLRYFNPRAPLGQRVTYDLDIVRDATGRESRAMSKAMLEQTQWLSTFKRNVQQWADAL